MVAVFRTEVAKQMRRPRTYVALGIAVARSRALPRWAGIGMAVGIVVFGVIGVILADFVQSIGAALLVASTAWLAYSARRPPALP